MLVMTSVSPRMRIVARRRAIIVRRDIDGAIDIPVPVTIHINNLGSGPMAAGGHGGSRGAAERAAQDRTVASTQLGAQAGSQRAAERAAQHRIPRQTAGYQRRRRAKRSYQ